MNEQFYPAEFDEWAEHYDQTVSAGPAFPFAGYDQVLQTIFEQAQGVPGSCILDLGTGTGNLAALFARSGCRVWGLDFSEQMLVQARLKLPQVNFARADVREPLPAAFQQAYQAVVSGYTFHHFPLAERVALVSRLLGENVLPGGRVLIGDIVFQDAAAEDKVRRSEGENWEQEYFWLADESLAAFRAAGIAAAYTPISFCAGVFCFNTKS
jgi:putative AdoMet-dependent methyltransferase